MEEDFVDDDFEESVAFNSRLDGYENYQRRPFVPNTKDPLYLMNIDVAASYQKKYVKEKVWQNDTFVEKEFTIKRPLIQIYSTTPNGDSVCVNVRDFVPYFFAPLPQGMEDTP